MRIIQSQKNWLIALAGGVCLVGAAVGMAQRQSKQTAPHVRDAHELSNVFRHVAREVLPSVVSIETRGKVVRVSHHFELPFGDDSPFGDLFKNDPRFRDFFKKNPDREFRMPRGTGSGFIIDKAGIIMTNSHVVSGAEEVKIRLHDGREFLATEWKTDAKSDIAVIRIDAPRDLKAIAVGDSNVMEIGDWVLAVGSPFGQDMSVTAGIISAKGRGPGINEREDYLQTDAAINPGNSGGPLLNLNGEVIGVNTAISSRSGGYDGVGFSIPINMAQWVARQLIEQGEVQRAFLGVSIQQVDSDLAPLFNIAVGQGAIVNKVIPDSPAALAKLQTGDVILKLDGKQVRGTRSLQGIVEKLAVGNRYQMDIIRAGKPMGLSIVLRKMPKDFSLNRNVTSREETRQPAEKPSGDMGIEIEQLTPEIARQLEMQGAEGVVITSIKTASPAHLAGLRTGQIIEKIGTRKITSPNDYRQAIKESSLKKGIVLLVRSPAGAQFVVVKANR